MAELKAIAAVLKRQRQDLEKDMEDTSSREIQTAEILGRIEDLRRRVEDTRRGFGVADGQNPAEK